MRNVAFDGTSAPEPHGAGILLVITAPALSRRAGVRSRGRRCRDGEGPQDILTARP